MSRNPSPIFERMLVDAKAKQLQLQRDLDEVHRQLRYYTPCYDPSHWSARFHVSREELDAKEQHIFADLDKVQEEVEVLGDVLVFYHVAPITIKRANREQKK